MKIKKILSVLTAAALSVTMCLSMNLTASAEEIPTNPYLSGDDGCILNDSRISIDAEYTFKQDMKLSDLVLTYDFNMSDDDKAAEKLYSVEAAAVENFDYVPIDSYVQVNVAGDKLTITFNSDEIYTTSSKLLLNMYMYKPEWVWFTSTPTLDSVTVQNKSVYNVSTYDELKSAVAVIRNGSKTGTINITSDGIIGERVDIGGMDITLNLNGHTLNCGLNIYNGSNVTINGDGGTIQGLKDATGYSDMVAVNVVNSTLTATNTKFIGADSNADVQNGMYSIIANTSDVKLDNCYVQSGNSLNTYVYRAITLSNSTLLINNTTVANGSGTEDKNFVIDVAGNSTVYDFNGTAIDKIEYQVYDIATFGLGYGIDVTGNVIKDTDGTPARGETPTTMTATIPEPTYTVTIPKTVSFGRQKQALTKYENATDNKDLLGNDVVVEEEFEITAENVDNLFADETHEDTITVSVNYDGLMKKADSTVTIPYVLKDVAAGTETPIATFYNDVDVTEEHTNSVTLTASLNRAKLVESGLFTGTMTFTVGQTVKEAG